LFGEADKAKTNMEITEAAPEPEAVAEDKDQGSKGSEVYSSPQCRSTNSRLFKINAFACHSSHVIALVCVKCLYGFRRAHISVLASFYK
jgi:hypothetical protein